MEPNKKKVIAAISAAMNAYLEEEQAALQAMQKRAAGPMPAFNPWVLAGRAAAMEMRRNWQLRLVR